jgi:hypothetical protein
VSDRWPDTLSCKDRLVRSSETFVHAAAPCLDGLVELSDHTIWTISSFFRTFYDGSSKDAAVISSASALPFLKESL